MEFLQSQLEALRAERRGYAQRGLDDRAAEVDAEIERMSKAATARAEAGGTNADHAGSDQAPVTRTEADKTPAKSGRGRGRAK